MIRKRIKEMKRYIIILACTLLTMAINASSPALRADSAYTAEQYADALSLYRQAAQEEGTSSDLYYNIGNTLYRQGKIAEAIIAYERALKLDPTNSDARANLEFLNSKIVDKAGERGTFFSNAMDEIARTMKADTWAWLALAFFTLTILAVCMYCFMSSIPLRKTGFFGGIATLILCVVGCIFAIRGASLSKSRDYAVVTVPSTILSTSPRTPKNRTEEAMLLHEGTKMQIMDSVSARTDSANVTRWYDVKIDNNHRAWIRSTDVEII